MSIAMMTQVSARKVFRTLGWIVVLTLLLYIKSH